MAEARREEKRMVRPASRHAQPSAYLPKDAKQDGGLMALQRRAGNQAVLAWLAHRGRRESEGPVGTTSGLRQHNAMATTAKVVQREPIGLLPRGICTDYGDFMVYPDSFVGALPLNDRSHGSWSVRESDFRAIKALMTPIIGGTSHVRIVGTAAFKSAVLVDLGWLMSQSVGRELVTDMIATGKTLTIEASAGGNQTSYDPDADSWETVAPGPVGGPPVPAAGPGANATIGYNIAEWNPYGGVEAWMTRPPAIGLAHEMVHAWTAMHGMRATGETAGVRNRELQATGLDAYASAAQSENRFRAAFGLPLRPRY